MLHRSGSVAALAVTVALLGACSGSGDAANPPPSTARPTVPAASPSSTTTTTVGPTVPTAPDGGDFVLGRDPFTPQG